MYRDSRDPRSRVISALLALALVLLMFGVLIEMGFIDIDRGPSGGGMLISMRTGSDAPSAKKSQHAAQHATHAAQHQAPQPTPTTPAPMARIQTPVTAPTPQPTGGFIHMTHDELASADISKMGQAHSNGSGSSFDPSKTYGPGEGPGGTHLFPANWYREPSDAEIGAYIKHGAPPGSTADIACKTTDHYHVEDCQELDESPPGSGLSRALRLAAWQFLVRPPIINGVPQLGVWVRIHFDFVRRPHGDGDSGGDGGGGAGADPAGDGGAP